MDELTRLRINHLKRMAQRAYWIHGWYIDGDPVTPITKEQKRNLKCSDRMYKLYTMCIKEIELLKDEK